MMSVNIRLCFVLLSFCGGLNAAADYKDNLLRFVSEKSLNKHDKNHYRDCHEVRHSGGYSESGLYTLHPNKSYSCQLHCEHSVDISFTVIQRRVKGDVDFNKGYTDYLNYFGGSGGDYWAGLYTINALSGPPGQSNVLKIDMQTWDGRNASILYNRFNIDDQTSFFLKIGGFQSTQLQVDDLALNNGSSFATPDIPDINGCASALKAGWWFNNCTYFLPNGHYYQGGKYTPSRGVYDGIFYKDWTGYGYSLKSVIMSVGRV